MMPELLSGVQLTVEKFVTKLLRRWALCLLMTWLPGNLEQCRRPVWVCCCVKNRLGCIAFGVTRAVFRRS